LTKFGETAAKAVSFFNSGTMRGQSPLLAQKPKNAIDVAFGGNADMGWCGANVCF